jgi:hypothetical protein
MMAKLQINALVGKMILEKQFRNDILSKGPIRDQALLLFPFTRKERDFLRKVDAKDLDDFVNTLATWMKENY